MLSAPFLPSRVLAPTRAVQRAAGRPLQARPHLGRGALRRLQRRMVHLPGVQQLPAGLRSVQGASRQGETKPGPFFFLCDLCTSMYRYVCCFQSSEDDSNRDGKLDQLELSLDLPLKAGEAAVAARIFLFFDVKLYVGFGGRESRVGEFEKLFLPDVPALLLRPLRGTWSPGLCDPLSGRRGRAPGGGGPGAGAEAAHRRQGERREVVCNWYSTVYLILLQFVY